jgi:hypothetical protein
MRLYLRTDAKSDEQGKDADAKSVCHTLQKRRGFLSAPSGQWRDIRAASWCKNNCFALLPLFFIGLS